MSDKLLVKWVPAHWSCYVNCAYNDVICNQQIATMLLFISHWWHTVVNHRSNRDVHPPPPFLVCYTIYCINYNTEFSWYFWFESYNSFSGEWEGLRTKIRSANRPECGVNAYETSYALLTSSRDAKWTVFAIKRHRGMGYNQKWNTRLPSLISQHKAWII